MNPNNITIPMIKSLRKPGSESIKKQRLYRVIRTSVYNKDILIDFSKEYILNGMVAKKASLAIGDKPSYASVKSGRYLKIPFVQAYIKYWQDKMSNDTEINLEWKKEKLRKIIDTCIPLDREKSDVKPAHITCAIAAIQELNKMQGHGYNILEKEFIDNPEKLADHMALVRKLEDVHRKDY